MFRLSFHSDNMSPQLFVRNLVCLPNKCNDLCGEDRIIIYGLTQATFKLHSYWMDIVVINNSSMKNEHLIVYLYSFIGLILKSIKLNKYTNQAYKLIFFATTLAIVHNNASINIDLLTEYVRIKKTVYVFRSHA